MTRLVSFKNVSLSDLIRCPGYDGTEAKTKELLWQLGCDTSHEIDVQVVQHRNMSNQIVTCEYYLCRERTDRAWIQSGHASIEALYASKPDAELQKDMIKMSRQGQGSREFKVNKSDKSKGIDE